MTQNTDDKKICEVTELDMEVVYWRKLMVFHYLRGGYENAMNAQWQMLSAEEEFQEKLENLTIAQRKMLRYFGVRHGYNKNMEIKE